MISSGNKTSRQLKFRLPFDEQLPHITNSVINTPEIIVNETDILNEKYKILKIKDLKARYGIENDAAYALVRRKDFPSFVLPNNSFATREDLLLDWEKAQMSAPKKYH